MEYIWITYVARTRHAAASVNSVAFCTIMWQIPLVTLFRQTIIDLKFPPTPSATPSPWSLTKYFYVKGLLYFWGRCLSISTQYIFLNLLEGPWVHIISSTSCMLLILSFIQFFYMCSKNAMVLLVLCLKSVQIRKVCVSSSKKHATIKRVTLPCVHKALCTSFWCLHSYAIAKSHQLHSVLSSYQSPKGILKKKQTFIWKMNSF